MLFGRYFGRLIFLRSTNVPFVVCRWRPKAENVPLFDQQKWRKRWKQKIENEISVTRLGDISKFLATNLHTKSSPIYNFENALQSKKCSGYYFGNFDKYLDYFLFLHLVTLNEIEIVSNIYRIFSRFWFQNLQTNWRGVVGHFSVTRLGDLLDFGQLFKAFVNN